MKNPAEEIISGLNNMFVIAEIKKIFTDMSYGRFAYAMKQMVRLSPQEICQLIPHCFIEIHMTPMHGVKHQWYQGMLQAMNDSINASMLSMFFNHLDQVTIKAKGNPNGITQLTYVLLDEGITMEIPTFMDTRDPKKFFRFAWATIIYGAYNDVFTPAFCWDTVRSVCTIEEIKGYIRNTHMELKETFKHMYLSFGDDESFAERKREIAEIFKANSATYRWTEWYNEIIAERPKELLSVH